MFEGFPSFHLVEEHNGTNDARSKDPTSRNDL